MRPTLKFLSLAALVVGIAGSATAQQAPAAPRGPGGPMAGRAIAPRGNVTAILNARRALDLTPRQVAQLDSIERALHAERQRVAASMRPQMDSLRQRIRTQGVPRDTAARRQMREQAARRQAALRPQLEQLRQRDSAANAAAERVLTEAQRTKWRELQAERRGFQRGMRAGRAGARGPAMRGQPMRGQPMRRPAPPA